VLGLAPDFVPSALQILRMAALVGTRGQVPYLHSAEAPDPDGASFALHLQDGTWSKLQEGMQLACREGTARALDPENAMHIAAKTGTALHGKQFQSWITGYFPYDQPKYAFVLHAPVGTSQDAAVPKVHEFLFATKWP
ncbi:MAG TPA: penicillin-binding transpeptidase domain-containing protein, partial [Chroococcales cyanobacterium]